LRRIKLDGQVPDELAGDRVDQVLAKLFPEYSRSRLVRWLRSGQVTLDKQICKAKFRVSGGEMVVVDAELEVESEVKAEPIELDLIYEDDQLLVINKPAGLVVHPAAGNPDGTLQNALLHLDASLAAVPRAGIVHRLDKLTSGLLVVARTLTAHSALVQQLQARTVHREYMALVNSVLPAGGTIEAPIGRHPRDRLRMAVVSGGKEAITHYRVEQRYAAHTLLRVRLETGRTHQIRVHLTHLHTPIVGDPLYGGRLKLPAGCSDGLKQVIRSFHRQALHATRLELNHPGNGEPIAWETPVPDDMRHLIDAMQEDLDATE
jgi:23S rRNA pseudouridine1911/1915/1917 synthase